MKTLNNTSFLLSMWQTYARRGGRLPPPKFLGCVYNQILIPMVLRCACFARLKAPTKFSFKNFKADTELKTTIMDHRSEAFHPARNLRQAATKERLTTKEESTNGSCSLNFVELSHCLFVCLFFFSNFVMTNIIISIYSNGISFQEENVERRT